METINKIQKKMKEWAKLLKIWWNRPTSTFQQVFDIWKKQPILDKAFKDAAYMLKRDMHMFNEVSGALISESMLSGNVSSKNKTLLDRIVDEDQKINMYEQDIRASILDYLAENTAPDAEASLMLTSILIDLERLGDYTKDLAKLTLLEPIKLENEEYQSTISDYKTQILDIFQLTLDAFEKGDKTKAKQVMKLNVDFRKETDIFLLKLSKDTKIRRGELITYALYTKFFRRVVAHLENVASSVIRPFKYLGFKDKTIKKIKKLKQKKG